MEASMEIIFAAWGLIIGGASMLAYIVFKCDDECNKFFGRQPKRK